jgi:hypothetical protein
MTFNQTRLASPRLSSRTSERAVSVSIPTKLVAPDATGCLIRRQADDDVSDLISNPVKLDTFMRASRICRYAISPEGLKPRPLHALRHCATNGLTDQPSSGNEASSAITCCTGKSFKTIST